MPRVLQRKGVGMHRTTGFWRAETSGRRLRVNIIEEEMVELKFSIVRSRKAVGNRLAKLAAADSTL